MIIENFYMVLWFAFWIYILFCISAKLCADGIKRKRAEKQTELIRAFFSDGFTADEKQKKAICDCQATTCCLTLSVKAIKTASEGVRAKNEKLLRGAFHLKIEALKKDSAQKSCLILSCIAKTGIRSYRIDRFIAESLQKSKLEQSWANAALVYKGAEKITVGV